MQKLQELGKNFHPDSPEMTQNIKRLKECPKHLNKAKLYTKNLLSGFSKNLHSYFHKKIGSRGKEI